MCARLSPSKTRRRPSTSRPLTPPLSSPNHAKKTKPKKHKKQGGKLLAKTKATKAARHAYDEKVAAQLWGVSAEFAKVPKDPK